MNRQKAEGKDIGRRHRKKEVGIGVLICRRHRKKEVIIGRSQREERARKDKRRGKEIGKDSRREGLIYYVNIEHKICSTE